MKSALHTREHALVMSDGDPLTPGTRISVDLAPHELRDLVKELKVREGPRFPWDNILYIYHIPINTRIAVIPL